MCVANNNVWWHCGWETQQLLQFHRICWALDSLTYLESDRKKIDMYSHPQTCLVPSQGLGQDKTTITLRSAKCFVIPNQSIRISHQCSHRTGEGGSVLFVVCLTPYLKTSATTETNHHSLSRRFFENQMIYVRRKQTLLPR